ncbi:class I SAM-dependent methyltransferase [Salinithrix halophila]|uniref:Class I SAM-dependent methyltransferase n=1 Tax=Salinithrix halophila TaxID=1485204 RepID=A0ABV8J964_9BACL
MTDHYYSSRPGTESREREFETTLRGVHLRFIADAGVFAKKGVDYGTRLLIDTVQVPKQSDVLDLGCGYGPVGISIARTVPGCRVTMVDINHRALDLAKRNAHFNKVEDRVEVLESDGFFALSGRNYDTVLTNPPIRAGKQTVYRLFEESFAHLAPGGELWVVIRKQHGGPSARSKLEELFDSVKLADKKKGFWVLQAKKKP